jgi:hypothetical protein
MKSEEFLLICISCGFFFGIYQIRINSGSMKFLDIFMMICLMGVGPGLALQWNLRDCPIFHLRNHKLIWIIVNKISTIENYLPCIKMHPKLRVLLPINLIFHLIRKKEMWVRSQAESQPKTFLPDTTQHNLTLKNVHIRSGKKWQKSKSEWSSCMLRRTNLSMCIKLFCPFCWFVKQKYFPLLMSKNRCFYNNQGDFLDTAHI